MYDTRANLQSHHRIDRIASHLASASVMAFRRTKLFYFFSFSGFFFNPSYHGCQIYPLMYVDRSHASCLKGILAPNARDIFVGSDKWHDSIISFGPFTEAKPHPKQSINVMRPSPSRLVCPSRDGSEYQDLKCFGISAVAFFEIPAYNCLCACSGCNGRQGTEQGRVVSGVFERRDPPRTPWAKHQPATRETCFHVLFESIFFFFPSPSQCAPHIIAYMPISTLVIRLAQIAPR